MDNFLDDLLKDDADDGKPKIKDSSLEDREYEEIEVEITRDKLGDPPRKLFFLRQALGWRVTSYPTALALGIKCQDIITTVDGIPVTSLDFSFLTNTLLTEGKVKAVILRPPRSEKEHSGVECGDSFSTQIDHNSHKKLGHPNCGEDDNEAGPSKYDIDTIRKGHANTENKAAMITSSRQSDRSESQRSSSRRSSMDSNKSITLSESKVKMKTPKVVIERWEVPEKQMKELQNSQKTSKRPRLSSFMDEIMVQNFPKLGQDCKVDIRKVPLPKKTILQATADFNIVPPKEKATPTVVADDKVDNTKKDNDSDRDGNNLITLRPVRGGSGKRKTRLDSNSSTDGSGEEFSTSNELNSAAKNFEGVKKTSRLFVTDSETESDYEEDQEQKSIRKSPPVRKPGPRIAVGGPTSRMREIMKTAKGMKEQLIRPKEDMFNCSKCSKFFKSPLELQYHALRCQDVPEGIKSLVPANLSTDSRSVKPAVGPSGLTTSIKQVTNNLAQSGHSTINESNKGASHSALQRSRTPSSNQESSRSATPASNLSEQTENDAPFNKDKAIKDLLINNKELRFKLEKSADTIRRLNQRLKQSPKTVSSELNEDKSSESLEIRKLKEEVSMLKKRVYNKETDKRVTDTSPYMQVMQISKLERILKEKENKILTLNQEKQQLENKYKTCICGAGSDSRDPQNVVISKLALTCLNDKVSKMKHLLLSHFKAHTDYGRQEMFKLMSENNSNDSLQSTTRTAPPPLRRLSATTSEPTNTCYDLSGNLVVDNSSTNNSDLVISEVESLNMPNLTPEDSLLQGIENSSAASFNNLTLESNEKLIKIINEKQRQVAMLRAEVLNLPAKFSLMKEQFMKEQFAKEQFAKEMMKNFKRYENEIKILTAERENLTKAVQKQIATIGKMHDSHKKLAEEKQKNQEAMRRLKGISTQFARLKGVITEVDSTVVEAFNKDTVMIQSLMKLQRHFVDGDYLKRIKEHNTNFTLMQGKNILADAVVHEVKSLIKMKNEILNFLLREIQARKVFTVRQPPQAVPVTSNINVSMPGQQPIVTTPTTSLPPRATGQASVLISHVARPNKNTVTEVNMEKSSSFKSEPREIEVMYEENIENTDSMTEDPLFIGGGDSLFMGDIEGVEDGSYDITEDQITAPDEDIAASDNEEVEEIIEINTDTKSIIDSVDNLEQDIASNVTDVLDVNIGAKKSSERSPTVPSISVSKKVVGDLLSNNESNISTTNNIHRPSSRISIIKEFAETSTPGNNENIATPDNVESAVKETTGSSKELVNDESNSENNEYIIPMASSNKDTNELNINPETDNEKDDNTSLNEMVIDDNFDKDTNTDCDKETDTNDGPDKEESTNVGDNSATDDAEEVRDIVEGETDSNENIPGAEDIQGPDEKDTEESKAIADDETVEESNSRDLGDLNVSLDEDEIMNDVEEINDNLE